MKLKDIINTIEKYYPPYLAYDWDNPGLFYGNPEKEIKKIVTTLDITVDVINDAISQKADMILSHHPFTMSGLKNLSDNSMHSVMCELIIKNDICIYSAHTNMDVAENGINQKLCELFNLKNTQILEIDRKYENAGLGRIGDLETETELFDFCQKVKTTLNTPFVRVCGENRKIKKVCVASGSCSEFIKDAIIKCADVVITGDMKYHESINYVFDGIAIIDAGHYPTEAIVCDMFYDILKDNDLEIIKAKQYDIFKVI